MIDPSPSHAVLRELFDNSALAWGLVACGVGSALQTADRINRASPLAPSGFGGNRGDAF
jgi:hypothetical protein